MRAFSYLRVSGVSQISGDGFPRQRLACESYASKHNIEIVRWFSEDGVSGTKELENRPALMELFAACEESGVKTIIIERLDRLARDLMVSETIIADMQKKGYTLISVAEPDLCSDDPSRKLMRQIFSAIAEFDRAMIVLKLRSSRQRRKIATGRCEGRKPYGSTDGERPILDEMVRLRCLGLTYAEMATVLNFSGKYARNGGKWKQATIGKIMARNGAFSLPIAIEKEKRQQILSELLKPSMQVVESTQSVVVQ